MHLAAGTRLGGYDIVTPIGTGAMGEVYRARDVRLNRDVALKVLPGRFAANADRVGRFRREAQVLASLNHPNIAAIYGFEEVGDVHALILELVEGPTLADRIDRESIRVEEAVSIARQIADALDAAHERGVVHRDLKPANIKVRADGTVKVLDFGLAKALDTVRGDDGSGSELTIAAQETQPGVILGTPAYMSPEQARGRVIDKRTDIWAFGCVLFEMLAGCQPFAGETTTDVLAGVIERSPDWSRLPATTPHGIQRLLRRCLEKDPKRRLRDIADARTDIDDLPESAAVATAATRTFHRERLAWAALALTFAAIAAAVATRVRPSAIAPEIRFETALPPGTPSNFAQLAISPDGRHLVVAPTFEGRAALWLRAIDSVAGRVLPGTEGAYLPFWSPDGRSVAFFADRKLRRINLESEAVEIVADVGLGRGGAWQPDGSLLFAPSVNTPLFRVPSAGGPPTAVTKLEAGQTDHRAPVLLPDGQHFLFYARGTAQARGVYVAHLDGSGARRLLDADVPAVYSGSGHVLFVRQGDLYAQKFDVTRMSLNGAAYRVAGPITINRGVSLAALTASPSGALAYGAGSNGFRTQFAWFDRSGKRLENLGAPENTPLAAHALSPDGRQVAFSRIVNGNWDVWLLDLRGAISRVTSDPGLDFFPVWSADGQRLIYSSSQGSSANMYAKRMNDSGNPELLLTNGVPTDVSTDNRYLLYNAGGSTTQSDVWLLPLDGDRSPRPFAQSTFSERDGQFSPDGRWVAYQSNESGHPEVYVQSFPGTGNRVQVSTGGGEQPRWARKTSELFYIAADRSLTATSVKPTPGAAAPQLARPTPLFRTLLDPSVYQQSGQQYVVADDGRRFLMNVPTDIREPSSIVVIVNWNGNP
jgi:serine/threonine protein kinase/Tol biopolymer transport system component